MWGIKHPSKVFDYVTTKNTKPHLKALMLSKKYHSFDEEIKKELSSKAIIKEIKIQSPNNPAILLDAILIEYQWIS